MGKKQAASPKRSEPPQRQLGQKDAGESKSDKGPASEERGKEVRLEELRSSRSEDVVQQVLETGLDALGGAEALERLSEGSDDEVDKTMELFLVEFKKACRLPYVLVEMVEKLARSEVAAKRASMKSRAARITD